MSYEAHVMLSHFFLQGLRVDATAYIQVLDMLVKPRIKEVAVQQNRSLPHDLEWLAGNY